MVCAGCCNGNYKSKRLYINPKVRINLNDQSTLWIEGQERLYFAEVLAGFILWSNGLMVLQWYPSSICLNQHPEHAPGLARRLCFLHLTPHHFVQSLHQFVNRLRFP